jgi:hypothetical protein
MEGAAELGSDVSWGEGGPHLLTKVLESTGRASNAFPAEYAYPIFWTDPLAIYRPTRAPDIQQRIDKTQAPFLHLWNSQLNRTGVQKNIAPPTGSYLARVAHELNVEWPNPEVRYSAKAIDRMDRHYRRSQKLFDVEGKINAITGSRLWRLASALRRVLGRPSLNQ